MAMQSKSYTWKITDPKQIQQMKTAQSEKVFKSPVFSLFNFRWELECYPNGNDIKNTGNTSLFLNLIALSPKILSVSVNCSYIFIEGNVSRSVPTKESIITHDTMYLASWPLGTLKTADIHKFDQWTFRVDIRLDGVFDNDGGDIINKYLKNEERKTEISSFNDDQQFNSAKLDSIVMQIDKLNQTVKVMQQKINNLELRMDEESKTNDDDKFNKLNKTIQLMQKKINELSSNNINPEKQKLKSWFENVVKLPQYYDIFIESGIEDLSTVSLLTMGTLKDIGIDKIGHRVKLLHQIAALKSKGSNNAVLNEEGPTAYI